jgi:hypothetical protein
MEAIGKIIVKLPAQQGTSRAGNQWSKQEYVLETAEAYPKKIFFSFFGDKANQYPLEVGQQVKVSFDIDSHEYNGRWFTNINAWKAEPYEPSAAPSAAPAPGAPVAAPAPAAPAPGAPVDFGGGSSDDLPF